MVNCVKCNDTGVIYIRREDNDGLYICKKCKFCDKNYTTKIICSGVDKKSINVSSKDFINSNFKKRFGNILKDIKLNNLKYNYLMIHNDEIELLKYCDYLTIRLVRNEYDTKIYFIDDIFDSHFKNNDDYKNILNTDVLCILMGVEYLKSETSMINHFFHKFIITRYRNSKRTFVFYFKNKENTDIEIELSKRYGRKVSGLLLKNNMFTIISCEDIV